MKIVQAGAVPADFIGRRGECCNCGAIVEVDRAGDVDQIVRVDEIVQSGVNFAGILRCPNCHGQVEVPLRDEVSA